MSSIQSTTVKLPLNSRENIEQVLNSIGYDVLRWAIVEVLDDSVVVSVSYIDG